MQLIEQLSQQLGVDGDKAQALAGALLGSVQNAVTEKVSASAGEQVAAAVPELGAWKDKAGALLGGGGDEGGSGLGGMLGALAGGGGGGGGGMGGMLGALAGGSDDKQEGGAGLGDMLGALAGGSGSSAGPAMLIAVLGKIGVDSDKASMIAPIVWQFLESRLDGDLLDKIKGAVPFLSGGDAEGGGGVAGMLGGLLG